MKLARNDAAQILKTKLYVVMVTPGYIGVNKAPYMQK